MNHKKSHKQRSFTNENHRNFIPKKHLGQNFLRDKNIVNKIIQTCKLDYLDTVFEIGPGLGALTEGIAPQVAQLFAIEKDTNLYHNLSARFNDAHVHIINADFLEYDLRKLPPPTKIIGNLPYNISTPIIEKLIKEAQNHPTLFFTVQWEFGKRLAAEKGGKDYGSLTCFVRYYCDVKLLFRIKNTAFWPVPKVMSGFIELRIRKPVLKADNEDLLFKVIRQAFQQRRKKIVNSLENLIAKEEINEILLDLKIKPDLRAENLALEDYIRISNTINVFKEKEK